MSDLIDRQEAIDALAKVAGVGNRALDAIRALPTAEPKKGKWDFIGNNMFKCTCCGTAYTTQQLNGLRNYSVDPYAPNYCPNCGADMRGE